MLIETRKSNLIHFKLEGGGGGGGGVIIGSNTLFTGR